MGEKPVIEQTNLQLKNGNISRVDFQKSEDFNNLIKLKGYDVYHDKAYRCPCVGFETGQALSDCLNCGGIGWFFIDRVKTRMLIQRINAGKKYENWNETETGSASITTMAENRPAYMDRIIVLDIESIYNQICKVRKIGSSYFFFTLFKPLEIIQAFYFFNSDKKLVNIPKQFFTIEDTVIKISDEFSIDDNAIVSIRYTHNNVYHILDLNRDAIKTRDKDCSDSNILSKLPISCVGKKAQFLFDRQNFYGIGLNENTNIT